MMLEFLQNISILLNEKVKNMGWSNIELFDLNETKVIIYK